MTQTSSLPPGQLLRADLHSHSFFSDGSLSPQELASHASAAGVQLWALTDHDEVSGIAHARAAAQALGMQFLSGVEISVTFANTSVHIVGLGIDENDAPLRAGLQQTRSGRAGRAQAMGEALAGVGIKDACAGALRHVRNPEMISRTHFARYLVEAGVCANVGEAFRRYLAEGKVGFVPHRWATLRDGVEWIVGSGGEAVIAHPARYRFDGNVEHALFTDFKNYGGRGVEVLSGSHSAQDVATYTAMAREFGLFASTGSDFHAPGELRCTLGSLPPLPAGLTPIWSVLQERIVQPHIHATAPSPVEAAPS